MTLNEFQTFLDSDGRMVSYQVFRERVYRAGVSPKFRKIAWRHLLNIFPEGKKFLRFFRQFPPPSPVVFQIFWPEKGYGHIFGWYTLKRFLTEAALDRRIHDFDNLYIPSCQYLLAYNLLLLVMMPWPISVTVIQFIYPS